MRFLREHVAMNGPGLDAPMEGRAAPGEEDAGRKSAKQTEK